jgi:predicted TPR repeat methyltransferase
MSALELAALLQQAVALHQRGQFDAAEACYRQVLARDANQFDALHLSGVLARQRGDAQSARVLIERALQIDPQQAAAHCNLGAALQDLDLPKQALHQYELAIVLNPAYALAWNNHGNALRRARYFDAALISYENALCCQPDYAEAHYNVATALHSLGEYHEAAAGFRHALVLRPNYPDAWCNHGLALQMAGLCEAALVSYDRALSIAPSHATSWRNRGTALRKLQRDDEALYSYEQAIEHDPRDADTYLFYGNLLRELKRDEAAIKAYRQARICGADVDQVDYLLAALGAEAAPQSSPVNYVKDLFDNYAERFDTHLRDVLQYRTPELLLAALQNASTHFGDVVDLGCGTGLCGPLLRPFASSVTGVDLSPRMLEKARDGGAYDDLVCAEAEEFLRTQPARFDLAIAADVLVYIGNLAPLFAALSHALRTDGVFAFSVESHTGEGYVLRASQRYAHAETYLRDVATEHGWAIVGLESHVLRYDDGLPIEGYLIIARRTFDKDF